MSKLFPDIAKHRRELVEVIEDGSAKTFVYKDLDKEDNACGFLGRFFNKESSKAKEQTELD